MKTEPTVEKYKLEAPNMVHLTHTELVPTPTDWRPYKNPLCRFLQSTGNPGKLATLAALQLIRGCLFSHGACSLTPLNSYLASFFIKSFMWAM